MIKYAGAEWVKDVLKCDMSPIGEAVADLLGDVWLGIYHLGEKTLRKVNWEGNHSICVVIGWRNLCTYDPDDLTRLIVLAHDRMIRVEIRPHTFTHLELLFHQRHKKDGRVDERHPSLEDHMKIIRDHYKAAEE